MCVTSHWLIPLLGPGAQLSQTILKHFTLQIPLIYPNILFKSIICFSFSTSFIFSFFSPTTLNPLLPSVAYMRRSGKILILI